MIEPPFTAIVIDSIDLYRVLVGQVVYIFCLEIKDWKISGNRLMSLLHFQINFPFPFPVFYPPLFLFVHLYLSRIY